MSDVRKLLDVAAAQIGTAEDPKGSNRIKYNTAYYGREVSGSKYPWCMAFVWWCFREAGLSALFYDGKKTAKCTTLMTWARKAGQWVTAGYQAGDVFLYDWDGKPSVAEHTGIYTGVQDSRGRYMAIEGNTNDAVVQVARDAKYIIGAWRPAYAAEAPVSDSGTAESLAGGGLVLPALKKGDKGATVKAMQLLLVGYGCKLPKYGADGDFGAETYAAVVAYQTAQGLPADGVCGAQTWKRLLGVSA